MTSDLIVDPNRIINAAQPRIDVIQMLERSLDCLCSTDHYLFQSDASERSITHRLAVYLQLLIPELCVDCEYNRCGFEIKRLALSERTTKDDDTDAVTVFPDIIVHRRGTNEFNLLVVEVKKASARISSEYDIQKLQAFKRELAYQFAAHVIIGLDASGTFIRRIEWQGTLPA